MSPNREELTAAERRVLALAQRGLTNHQIATELGISENGVRYHLKELHSKLETGGDRAVLSTGRWRVSALVLLLKQHAATVGIAAGVGAVSLGGYFAIQFAHESRADDARMNSGGTLHCVAELAPTVEAGTASPGVVGERCFDTPEEVQAFYQSLR
ncbi:MAG: helix-turn-helix transcriptional regulator [Aridibacter famidurans]|nr:helix-turn-helix transcriptional regulator [Aridibacter famidurans]